MEIRKLQAQEWDQTAALVWQVFQEFEAPVYPPEGVESFAAFLRDRQGLLTLDGWASWDGPTLTGVLAARPGGGHICLLFVRADRHRQGGGPRFMAHPFDRDRPTGCYRARLSLRGWLLPQAGISGQGRGADAGRHPLYSHGVSTIAFIFL